MSTHKLLGKFLRYSLRVRSSRHLATIEFKEKSKTNANFEGNKMRAWQLHSYSEELQLTAARKPFVKNPRDVLINVEAASINPIDYAMKGGYGKTVLNFLRQNEIEFPLTLGRDFSGTIIDKGFGVGSEFNIGDKVYGIVPVHCQGSHAQNVIVDKSNINIRPSNLSHIEAASLMYAAMTAWSALYITGGLIFLPVRGTKVLIIGSSGGVGTIAVQLLKSQGAYVVGACSADAIPLVESLGADSVYDYKSPDYFNNIAAEGKFDIILDCAKFGYENLPSIWKYNKFITLNGNLLKNTDSYGLLPGMALSGLDLLRSNITNVFDGRSVRWAFFAPSKNAMKFIDKLVREQKIIPTIHKTYKFEEMPKAFETFAGGHLRGKIVVDFQ